ncbi:MAG: histidinol dehydrogenase [Salinisphaeraceae bacterium]|nr:histidinol dehydrogenase [Salinisphaeraceae bacterium]
MSGLDIARLDSSAADFESRFTRLIGRHQAEDEAVVARAQSIVEQVRREGDTALVRLTAELDRREVASVADLEVPRSQMQAALDALPAAARQALEDSAARLRDYAERQRLHEWRYADEHGNELGQVVRPLACVGVYAPGGKAAYPSTVLMNSVPAQVAGVEQIVLVSPAPGGELNPMVLAAAALAGVHRMFTIGGAQAVAALAWGTDAVPCVDKIVGPGNAYVAAAKRIVFGRVGIESIAGPSEVLVLADGRSDPAWAAMDLFAQAEHDEAARAILISPDAGFLDRVHEAAAQALAAQPRRQIIAASLAAEGALIKVRDMDEAVALSNRIAPEHLELAVDEPDDLLPHIQHAGAIFMGAYTPESFGDYCAGPNHVLPTGRTARFSSPLGVYDFQKRLSLIKASPQGMRALAPTVAEMARGEGLEAHARSAELRSEDR